MNVIDVVVSSMGKETPLQKAENTYRYEDVEVSFEERKGVVCYLTAQDTPVSYLKVYFEDKPSKESLVLGDAFERSYGDLEWKRLEDAGFMPWYFFLSEPNRVQAYGVKVRPAALCAWMIEDGRVCLHLDVCNGSRGVVLKGRKLEVAHILRGEYDGQDVFTACKSFCKKMCDDGIFPEKPVYGGNNWYYAYGKSSDAEILEDAKTIAELAEGLENRPFMIIDDCWSVNSCAGPWDQLRPTFKDMAKLAQSINEQGVLPGCWIRPLFYKNCEFPDAWILRRNDGGITLDVTVKEAREFVLQNFTRLKEWGYKLIKHDFTTFDFFGGFAFEFDGFLTQGKGEWSFADGSKTNAEIVVEFYKDVRKAAEDVMIMGCNTLSHLSAGLVELQRIGDDTSGVEWERTRKMGVNTLAFRLCQHGVFYAVDADCVGITQKIEWTRNRKWLDLVAKSGTPLFVSLSPDCKTEEIACDLRKAFQINSVQKDECIPLDWQVTKTPNRWKINGEEVVYDWE